MYTNAVLNEIHRRGYKCDFNKFDKYKLGNSRKGIEYNKLFKNWHNERYLCQCYYNLEEKYDCGGITFDEWSIINTFILNRNKEENQMLTMNLQLSEEEVQVVVIMLGLQAKTIS